MAEGLKLTREVLPPQKQSSGLGVMVVAATAMFFAVASSAFILRARMARSCCPAKVTSTPVAIEMDPVATQPTNNADDCGAAVVKRSPDGTETYYFEPCDRPLPTVIGETTDVEIREVARPIKGGVLVDKVHLPSKED